MNLAKSAALFYLVYSVVTDLAIWGGMVYYFFGGPTP